MVTARKKAKREGRAGVKKVNGNRNVRPSAMMRRIAV
jgi:hypothetical protein